MPQSNFLSENLIAIVAGLALLILLLTFFFATGRTKPRQPLGPRDGRGLSSPNWLARGEEADNQSNPSIVRRRRRGGDQRLAAAQGSPIGIVVVVLAVIAIAAAAFIVLAAPR